MWRGKGAGGGGSQGVGGDKLTGSWTRKQRLRVGRGGGGWAWTRVEDSCAGEGGAGAALFDAAVPERLSVFLPVS